MEVGTIKALATNCLVEVVPGQGTMLADGPAVFTVSVDVAELLPGLTLGGDREQEERVRVAGKEHVRETLLLNVPP